MRKENVIIKLDSRKTEIQLQNFLISKELIPAGSKLKAITEEWLKNNVKYGANPRKENKKDIKSKKIQKKLIQNSQ